MKTWLNVAALFILAAVPVRAAADDACLALLEQARELRAGTLACQASVGELTVSAGSLELGQKVRAALFPQDLFLGRKVRLVATTNRQATEAGGAAALKLPAFLSEVSADVDFDGAATREDAAFLPMDFDVALDTGTPPGSGGGGPPGSGGGGPPGSGGNTPPGSGGNTPPGSGGNTPPGSGGNTPPGSGGGQQNPPSKPIPVAPAPPPAWWNTASVQNLNGPLTSWGSDYYDAASGDGYTRWYPWPKYFYDTTRTTGKSVISRTAANAKTTYNSTLSSQEKTQTRECYYRAYYTWNSYEGRWDFDHYKGACAVINTQVSAADMMGVSVEFDMAGMSLLPWDKESIGISFDGTRVGVDLSGAAFKYAVTGPIVDQGNGTATVKLTAVSRVKRAPEKDKVNANLQKTGAKLQLVVKDDRASYYTGEVLQVKMLIKRNSGHWYKADPVIVNQTLNIKVNSNQSQTTTFDVPASVSGEYYIKEWSFRRENSQTSSDAWMYKGEGNRVTF